MFENGLQALTQGNIYKMLHTFEEYELSKNVEKVLGIVWNMNIHLLRVIINSNYSVFTPAEPETNRLEKFNMSIYLSVYT